MDLPFYNKELQINSFLPGMRYYEGEITDRWKTDMGHLLIVMKKPIRVKEYSGSIVKQSVDHPTMNFLVPKRREFLWNKLNEIPFGTNILIQLQQEGRSGKYCVSEFQISR